MIEGNLLELTKRVKDILSQVVNTGRMKHLDFLNVTEQDVLEKMVANTSDVSMLLQGGFSSAERRRAIVFPAYMNPTADDARVSVYKVEVIGGGDITHSQILGALLGLHIDRSVIGDIIVSKDQAHFAACTEFDQFLKDNFTKAGRHDIRLELVEDAVVCEQKFEEIEIIVSSMRLDVIVKALINASRGKAEAHLEAGFVRLNHAVDKKTSRNCNIGDILSIRKHGRFKLDHIKKRTKSDKFVLVVRKSV